MKTVFAFLGLLSATASVLVGQEDRPASRKTLAGLNGVYVEAYVSDSDEVERDGLYKAQVQTDMELKLRQAGVPVLSPEETASTTGQPSLVANILLVRNSSGLYASSVSVGLFQMVRPVRNPSVAVPASTWWTGTMVGIVQARRVADDTRSTVRDLTDQFINAYLAANPKR
jgi:hypothetical protein